MSIECTTCCNSGCQNCEKCDEGCMSDCNTSQAFCEKSQNSNNGFTFSSCVAAGEIIGPGYFSRNTWNEAINAINSVFLEGAQQNAAGFTISNNNSDTFISADEFIRVADAASYSNSGVKKDYVIYGSYYQGLESAIANLDYKQDQCDVCNIECDITCDKCEICDGGCDGCDSECGDYCCDCCDNNCCDNNVVDCKETEGGGGTDSNKPDTGGGDSGGGGSGDKEEEDKPKK